MTARFDIAALKKQGFIQQRQAEYVALRLRVTGGNVPADHLTTLRDISKRYGSGELHLTSRQCVEIPFIRIENTAKVTQRLEKAGIRLGTGGAAVRTVTGCPGCRVCPRGLIDSRGIAEAVDSRFYGSSAPHKFKVAVSGCPSACVKPQINDFGVWGVSEVACDVDLCIGCGICKKACRSSAIDIVEGKAAIDKAKCVGCAVCTRNCPKNAIQTRQIAYAVTVGGKMGRAPQFGRRLPFTLKSEGEVLETLTKVIEYYRTAGKPGERLADTLNRTGLEPLIANIAEGAPAAVRESAGAVADTEINKTVSGVSGNRN